jgi:DNA-binding transcriptional ArsR family regulator
LTAPALVDIFTHMGEYKGGSLDDLFFCLSHPVRRQMVRRMAGRGETRVTDLARSYRVSLNTVSKHIRVLERARLIRRRVSGRQHMISLDVLRLQDADRWLEHYRQFWTDRLDSLEALFRKKSEERNERKEEHHA